MEHPHTMLRKLALMTILSFIAMYILMYMMVDRFSDAYPSLNQFYMAGTMTAAMVVIELIVMRAMYTDKRTNVFIIGASLILLAACILGTRTQFAVSDKDFLRAMISHHSSALLMCKNSNLQDPEIKDLCQSILSSQQSQIDFMKAKL